MTGDPLVAAWDEVRRRAPEAIVVRAASRAVSRAELAARESDLAARIAGGRPGVPVALAIGDPVEFLAALIACVRQRRPALLLDPDTGRDTARRWAQRLGADRILAGGDLVVLGPTADRPLPPGTSVIKMTSGSSGEPRGVAFTSAALLADCTQLARTMGIQPEDRLLTTLPLSFSYGLSSLALPALVAGNELVVADPFSPAAALGTAARHRATVLPTVPVFVHALLRLHGIRALPPSLRLVIAAGAPLSPAAARVFHSRFGQPVHVFYGCSECGGISYDRAGTAAERGTVGTPVDGVTIELTRGDGTVRVTSAAVGLGYVPTAEPSLGAGTFTTADCAALEARELRLLGRTTEVVNVGGRKVHPREVETALARLNGVVDVVVRAEVLAERGTEICHAIVVAPGLDEAAIREHARRHLEPFKVPKRITMVAAIPRTGRGKLDRAALP